MKALPSRIAKIYLYVTFICLQRTTNASNQTVREEKSEFRNEQHFYRNITLITALFKDKIGSEHYEKDVHPMYIQSENVNISFFLQSICCKT